MDSPLRRSCRHSWEKYRGTRILNIFITEAGTHAGENNPMEVVSRALTGGGHPPFSGFLEIVKNGGE